MPQKNTFLFLKVNLELLMKLRHHVGSLIISLNFNFVIFTLQ